VLEYRGDNAGHGEFGRKAKLTSRHVEIRNYECMIQELERKLSERLKDIRGSRGRDPSSLVTGIGSSPQVYASAQ